MNVDFTAVLSITPSMLPLESLSGLCQSSVFRRRSRLIKQIWNAGVQENSTHLTKFKNSAYQRRREMLRHLLKKNNLTLNEIGLQQSRRALLSIASQVSPAGGLVFNSVSFVKSLGNYTGTTSPFGQTSLQVLKLNSAASKPPVPSAFSTILAGNQTQYWSNSMHAQLIIWLGYLWKRPFTTNMGFQKV